MRLDCQAPLTLHGPQLIEFAVKGDILADHSRLDTFLLTKLGSVLALPEFAFDLDAVVNVFLLIST